MITDSLENAVSPRPTDLLLRRTFAEFFAGIGLMRLGLERQGWSVAFANDIDEHKQTMYQGHFGAASSHFHLGDIHEIPMACIPPVTLATASFPCNDLSLAGMRQGLQGKQSSALWGFTSIIERMDNRRPPFILLENVPGFLTSRSGEDFRETLLVLNKLGYTVDVLLLDAVNFVPQSRQRLFVIGVRKEYHDDSLLRETLGLYESTGRPKVLADFILMHPEIDWSIRDVPDYPALSVHLEAVLDDLPVSAQEWWSAERSQYLLEQMSAKHRQTAETMIAANEYSYATIFRRVRNGKSMAELRDDGIAGCLRTPRGGSGRQILFKAGKGEYFVRLLTPRECARLMGADEYIIEVSSNRALFGFGDAVCVPVIEWIAQHYLNPLVIEVAQRIAGECRSVTPHSGSA